ESVAVLPSRARSEWGGAQSRRGAPPGGGGTTLHRGDTRVLRTIGVGDIMISNVQRVCAKLYADQTAEIRDDVFIALFHEWIQQRALPDVLLDVADYTHVPDGPGVILVGYATTFALDRSDGRFGLLAQRRRPDSDARSAIASVVHELLEVAARLEADK